MKRWDGLVETYIEEQGARGIHPATIESVHRELQRWGNWMKRRRPKLRLEAIEPQLLVRYVQDRTAFWSEATVDSVMSRMRGMGNFPVREGSSGP